MTRPIENSPFKALNRLQRALEPLNTLEKSAKPAEITRALGAAQAILRGDIHKAAAPTAPKADKSGAADLFKRAASGDIEAQRLVRQIVTNGVPSGAERAVLAAENIAKARGLGAPNPAANDVLLVSQQRINASRAVAYGTREYGRQRGMEDPSRSVSEMPPIQGPPKGYPAPSDGNPRDLEAWWTRAEKEPLDPATWEPIGQDARARRTTTGPVMTDLSDIADRFPVGTYEPVGDGHVKTARGVEIAKIRKALRSELERIAKS